MRVDHDNFLLTLWGLSVEVATLCCLRVSTGHSSESCGKEGKKNSLSGFPCLDWGLGWKGPATSPEVLSTRSGSFHTGTISTN